MESEIKHVHDTGAYRYASDVLEEKLKTGKLIKKAAQRFMDDLKRDDILFDLVAARKIVNFSKLCYHWKGPKAGTPIILDPHQEFYFQQLFGWKYAESGLRRFRRSAKLIARKQGKTTEVAVQAKFHALIDEPNGPQIWIGATKKDQAKICLKDVANILKKSPALKSKFKTFWNQDLPTKISCPSTNGAIAVIGRDSDKEDGLDVSMAIIDEWHAHKDTGIRDILSSATGNRAQPLESIISTAGFNLHGPCYTKTRKIGIDILEGRKVDDQQLVIFYELDDFEAWEDEKEWICANPNIPYYAPALSTLQSEYTRAKNEKGSTEVNFKTKHLNIWTNSAEGWIEHETILGNNHGIQESELLGRECFCGLDLSAGKDLNAFALFFPDVRPGIHAAKLMFWVPEVKITEQQDEIDYALWEQEGVLKKFSGNVVEYEFIAHDMINEMSKYDVQVLGADPKYLYTGPIGYLRNAGYEEKIVPVGQGFNLTSATEQIETWTAGKQMDFLNNPLLTWNFSNVTLHVGISGHKYPSKGKSINKIDGVSALCTAVEEYLRLGAEPAIGSAGIIAIEW